MKHGNVRFQSDIGDMCIDNHVFLLRLPTIPQYCDTPNSCVNSPFLTLKVLTLRCLRCKKVSIRVRSGVSRGTLPPQIFWSPFKNVKLTIKHYIFLILQFNHRNCENYAWNELFWYYWKMCCPTRIWLTHSLASLVPDLLSIKISLWLQIYSPRSVLCLNWQFVDSAFKSVTAACASHF